MSTDGHHFQLEPAPGPLRRSTGSPTPAPRSARPTGACALTRPRFGSALSGPTICQVRSSPSLSRTAAQVPNATCPSGAPSGPSTVSTARVSATCCSQRVASGAEPGEESRGAPPAPPASRSAFRPGRAAGAGRITRTWVGGLLAGEGLGHVVAGGHFRRGTRSGRPASLGRRVPPGGWRGSGGGPGASPGPEEGHDDDRDVRDCEFQDHDALLPSSPAGAADLATRLNCIRRTRKKPAKRPDSGGVPSGAWRGVTLFAPIVRNRPTRVGVDTRPRRLVPCGACKPGPGSGSMDGCGWLAVRTALAVPGVGAVARASAAAQVPEIRRRPRRGESSVHRERGTGRHREPHLPRGLEHDPHRGARLVAGRALDDHRRALLGAGVQPDRRVRPSPTTSSPSPWARAIRSRLGGPWPELDFGIVDDLARPLGTEQRFGDRRGSLVRLPAGRPLEPGRRPGTLLEVHGRGVPARSEHGDQLRLLVRRESAWNLGRGHRRRRAQRARDRRLPGAGRPEGSRAGGPRPGRRRGRHRGDPGPDTGSPRRPTW